MSRCTCNYSVVSQFEFPKQICLIVAPAGCDANVGLLFFVAFSHYCCLIESIMYFVVACKGASFPLLAVAFFICRCYDGLSLASKCFLGDDKKG